MKSERFEDNAKTESQAASKPKSLKLRLDKQIIRTLSGSELAQAAGGFATGGHCCNNTVTG